VPAAAVGHGPRGALRAIGRRAIAAAWPARRARAGPPMSALAGLDLAAVERAAARLRPVAVRTPLLESAALNARIGGRLLLKAEPLQRTGSFKFRGAYNALSQQPGRPVVAYSSGNHAQGVAAAARLLGVPATILMPADAPAIKRANTEAQGAKVQLYDRYREVREALGEQVAARTGAVLVRPYDDAAVIAGQGTVALELVEQLAARDAAPEAVLVCCGGGGLIAGCGLVLRARLPAAALYAVEPEGFDDTRRSLAAGRRLANRPGARSICDALLAERPGELTFALNRHQLAGGLAVSDAEVAEAMRVAFRELKLVVEPGGAVALAAVLAGKLPTAGRTLAAVLSGGNVDPDRYAAILAAPAAG
jgi:threonine dehydratase